MLTFIPNSFWLIYIGVLGACLGSFANVLIVRLPEEMSPVRPRSHCPQCKQQIAWYDNIPLLSYLFLRGRCRRCHADISIRYWVVEILMTVLALALWARLGLGWPLLVWLLLSTVLMAIVFLDLNHWWIPDVLIVPSAILLLAAMWLPGMPGFRGSLFGVLPAMGLFLIGWIFKRLTKREGLGLGDVKLLAILGLALGLWGALNTLVLAALEGAVIGIFYQLYMSKIKKHTPPLKDQHHALDAWQPPPGAIAFGPFLVLGALQTLLLPDLMGNILVKMSALWGQLGIF